MDKPFKTIDEQIAILEHRGLSCDRRTGSVLQREGYYPVVNGYKDLFIDGGRTAASGEDTYMSGSTFGDVYRLFEFDRSLRMTLFRYFNKAEATLKTVSAYQFARLHDDEPEAYLSPKAYRTDRSHAKLVRDLISDFESLLGRNGKRAKPYKREYIEHYERNHDATPIWVLMNFLMLGQAFKFYDFQPERVRNAIAHEFSDLYAETHRTSKTVSHRRLRIAYDHIKDFRNICAHDERLFCARVSPSKDTTLVDMLKDLELVLTCGDYRSLRREVTLLLVSLADDIGHDRATEVLRLMGGGRDTALPTDMLG